MSIKKIAAKEISAEEQERASELADAQHYVLKKPLAVGNATLTKLLVDPSEMTGAQYFSLVKRFKTENPGQVVNFKMSDEIFLSYVLAALNPPMTLEDCANMSFVELEFALTKLMGNFFQAGATTPKSE
jgi:hypothetical protein